MLRKQKMVFHNIFCAIISREDELVYLKPSQNSVLSQRCNGGGGVGASGHRGIGLTLKRCFSLLVPAAFVDSNIFETTTRKSLQISPQTFLWGLHRNLLVSGCSLSHTAARQQGAFEMVSKSASGGWSWTGLSGFYSELHCHGEEFSRD